MQILSQLEVWIWPCYSHNNILLHPFINWSDNFSCSSEALVCFFALILLLVLSASNVLDITGTLTVDDMAEDQPLCVLLQSCAFSSSLTYPWWTQRHMSIRTGCLDRLDRIKHCVKLGVWFTLQLTSLIRTIKCHLSRNLLMYSFPLIFLL